MLQLGSERLWGPPRIETVRNLADLQTRFELWRLEHLELLPPDAHFRVGVPRVPGLLAFEPHRFPRLFLDGLKGRWAHGVRVYDIALSEDPRGRDLVL